MRKTRDIIPQMDIVISRQDLAVLRAHFDKNCKTEAQLIARIVHQWATDPIRFANHLLLPPNVRTFLDGESLRSYLRRVALALISAVRQSEPDTFKAAKRLGYERTALAKLFRRLKDGQSSLTHFEYEDDSIGLLPLKTLVQRQAKFALKACRNNKEQAAAMLGITRAELDQILGSDLISLVLNDAQDRDLILL